MKFLHSNKLVTTCDATALRSGTATAGVNGSGYGASVFGGRRLKRTCSRMNLEFGVKDLGIQDAGIGLKVKDLWFEEY